METTITKCDNCGKNYENPNRFIRLKEKRNHTGNYCSRICYINSGNIDAKCSFCKLPIRHKISESKKSKSGRMFCNRSCACSFNNTQKRKSRCSKAETKLFNLLKEQFPNLDLLPNDKTMLNGLEVDIAVPSIKLAIEWNGIVHFKPIYGQDKLDKIQSKDYEKQTLANNKNINLIVIPDLVSSDEHINNSYLKIKEIIENLLN